MTNEETMMKIDGILRQNEQDTERKEAFLPTDCVQNHAANLLELDNGDVLCVWFGGTQEGIPDISIYMSRLKRGSNKWTEAVKLSNDPARSEQNPVLFQEEMANYGCCIPRSYLGIKIPLSCDTGYQRIEVRHGVRLILCLNSRVRLYGSRLLYWIIKIGCCPSSIVRPFQASNGQGTGMSVL